MNQNASRTDRMACASASGSTDPILGSQSGEQVSNPAFGRVEIFFAPMQRGAEIGQFCMQSLAITVTGVVAHVSTPGRSNLQQTFGGEHADGGLCCVQRDPMSFPELPVRRYSAAWWAGAADDVGPENIGEPVARKPVYLQCHTATITSCLKTDTHCRRRVDEGFATTDDNCPRAAAAAGPRPASPWPAQWCPACGTGLDGGPVVFWCAGCRRGVQAADLDVEYRAPGLRGRAA